MVGRTPHGEVTWKLELLPGGGCDLFRDRRLVAYDLDFDEAIEMARTEGATSVEVVELDGYVVTRRI